MIIQNKTFPDGQLIFYNDYKRSTHAGANGCFQISDICLEGYTDESILKELNIDQGVHYHDMKEVFKDLMLPSNFNNYREEIV